MNREYNPKKTTRSSHKKKHTDENKKYDSNNKFKIHMDDKSELASSYKTLSDDNIEICLVDKPKKNSKPINKLHDNKSHHINVDNVIYSNKSRDNTSNIDVDEYDDDEYDYTDDISNNIDESPDLSESDQNLNTVDKTIDKKIKIENDKKTKEKLKKKISEWMDFDDKIKEHNAKLKIFKTSKKENEKLIIDIIEKLELGDLKFVVPDEKSGVRGHVYREKKITRQAIKEDTIKCVLMEVVNDQNKVDQLLKKIDAKRTIVESYRLKRTKGNQNNNSNQNNNKIEPTTKNNQKKTTLKK